MKRWRALLPVLGALFGLFLIVGCGGSSSGTGGTASAEGKKSYKEICLGAREGSAGLHSSIAKVCAEHGVTATSPPRSSPAAQKAREVDATESARENQKYNDDPVHESYNRSAAMADLATGEPEAARQKLAEGCPKSSPAEVEEAFEELEEIALGPEASSVAQLEKELEEICPL